MYSPQKTSWHQSIGEAFSVGDAIGPSGFCFLWDQLLHEVEEEVKILFYTFNENPVGHSNFHMQFDAHIDKENVIVVCHTQVNCCILLPCSVFH